MERLETLLEKYDFPKRAVKSIATIKEIESLIEFRLPDDYKYFLNNYLKHESFIGPEYVSLWSLDNLLEYNNGYQIQQYLDNTILGIGSNGAGECIAIELFGSQSHRIVLTPFIFEKECNIEIGTSFTDMLSRLDSGKEWFS